MRFAEPPGPTSDIAIARMLEAIRACGGVFGNSRNPVELAAVGAAMRGLRVAGDDILELWDLPKKDEDLKVEVGVRLVNDPGIQRKQWTASVTRNAYRALLTEQRDLLVRMALVFEAIQDGSKGDRGEKGVTRGRFTEICHEAQISPYWLWLEGRPSWALTGSRRPAPVQPIDIVRDKSGDQVILRKYGEQVTGFLGFVGGTDPALADMARILGEGEGFGIPPEPFLSRWFRRLHVKRETFEAAGLGETPRKTGEFKLTEKGKVVGGQTAFPWYVPFWPSPEEEAALPEKWDWSMRPFLEEGGR